MVPAPDQELFHVTETDRVPRIREQGLTIGNASQWRNRFGAALGDRRAVYLFSDFSKAVRFAHRFYYDGGLAEMSCVSILRVRGVDWGLVPDDNIEAQLDGGGWWKSPRPVPPQAILGAVPLEAWMCRALVQHGHVEPPAAEGDTAVEYTPVP